MRGARGEFVLADVPEARMQPRKLRVRPLQEEEWTDEIPRGASRSIRIGDNPQHLHDARPAPKLLKRWLVFANHIMVKSTLPPRARELLICGPAIDARVNTSGDST